MLSNSLVGNGQADDLELEFLAIVIMAISSSTAAQPITPLDKILPRLIASGFDSWELLFCCLGREILATAVAVVAVSTPMRDGCCSCWSRSS